MTTKSESLLHFFNLKIAYMRNYLAGLMQKHKLEDAFDRALARLLGRNPRNASLVIWELTLVAIALCPILFSVWSSLIICIILFATFIVVEKESTKFDEYRTKWTEDDHEGAVIVTNVVFACAMYSTLCPLVPLPGIGRVAGGIALTIFVLGMLGVLLYQYKKKTLFTAQGVADLLIWAVWGAYCIAMLLALYAYFGTFGIWIPLGILFVQGLALAYCWGGGWFLVKVTIVIVASWGGISTIVQYMAK